MVWIDLTDLFTWRGSFTGIQRVSFSYATRFEKEGARFFVYSVLYDRFVEVPLSLVDRPAEEDTEQNNGITRRQKLKKRLLKTYKKLPTFSRRVLNPPARYAHRTFRKIAAFVLDSRSRDHELRKLPVADFKQNDTLVMLGAGWNCKELIGKVSRMKQTTGLKVVVHLNDILPIYQPYLFAEELHPLFAGYTNKALRIADVVTVISQATKSDVLRYCQENSITVPKIEIIRLGEDVKHASPKEPPIAIADKFILAVGTFEIRKNYLLIYQLVKLAKAEGKEIPQIVIAGRKGWLTHDLQYVLRHDLDIKDKLVWLENMNDANLTWLYEKCLFTVFSSVAEGWGLPIAESLQHGKFCLSSSVSSMPEIAGDMIDYFTPYDPRNCLEKILLYTNEKILADKHNEIIDSYKVYSWDDSFESFKKAII
jgi:glycosyltransferase involved in cell wall biosynthesis